MITSKLILVEGPPGSGKSTTAQILAEEISKSGKKCQYFLEWSPNNPIAIGDDFQLGKAVETSIAREGEVLQQWRHFAQDSRTKHQVTVMESRFWQTSMMLMYAAGHPIEGVVESNQLVVNAIRGLDPVLIYLTIDDLRSFLERIIRLKEAEWLRDGIEGSWAQHVFDAFGPQKWFTDRGLSGIEGMVAFLEEWVSVAETLYERLPFPKVKIRNPYQDWQLAMQKMRAFLDLGGV